jgi:hypothetical protein
MSSGLTSKDFAKIAIETLGCKIGIGLGSNFIHIDTRGSLGTWVYNGAEMDDPKFKEKSNMFLTIRKYLIFLYN